MTHECVKSYSQKYTNLHVTGWPRCGWEAQVIAMEADDTLM